MVSFFPLAFEYGSLSTWCGDIREFSERNWDQTHRMGKANVFESYTRILNFIVKINLSFRDFEVPEKN